MMGFGPLISQRGELANVLSRSGRPESPKITTQFSFLTVQEQKNPQNYDLSFVLFIVLNIHSRAIWSVPEVYLLWPWLAGQHL